MGKVSSAGSSAEDVAKRTVEEGYDRVALSYGELEGASEWPRMRWLRRLPDRVPNGGHVLDLGCGSALPVGPEVVRRHRLTGIDISAAQIELARRNVPEASFIHSDVASLDLPLGEFDAVVSFYAIDHIPRTEHGGLMRDIHSWLRPGGLLLISVEAGDEPGVTGEWLGTPMYFSHFDEATTTALVEAAGFAVIETALESQDEQGREVPYLWLLASSRAEPGRPPQGAAFRGKASPPHDGSRRG